MMFQVLISSGYDDSIIETDERVIYVLALCVGVTLIAILIGLITDSVNGYMESMSTGSTKVVEKGHTLILGWNQSSVRVVCQIAFLRHVLRSQNQTWARWLFPWLRVQASTPVAAATVVILSTMDKGELETIIRDAFDERNISPKFTMVGRDIVVRQGEPSNAHDLVRMAAHDAASILIMMTEDDAAEAENEGTADNSATIRTVLALRNVMYSNGVVSETFTKDLRVVVELSTPCPFIAATTFVDPKGTSVLYPQELSRTINALLFYCAAKPGLSRIIMSILDFQSPCLRARPASWLRAGPSNTKGWCVGKTIREVLASNCWDNAICLGCDDNDLNIFDSLNEEYNKKFPPGIMGEPERIVKETDVIIFLSSSSTPHVGNQYRFEKKLDSMNLLEGTKLKQVRKDVVICGWRGIWDFEPIRVKRLLADLYDGLAPGTTVTFATRKPRDKFEKSFEQVKNFNLRKKGENYFLEESIFEGLIIRHYHADPVKMKDMEGLFKKYTFDTAIVLGTAAGLDLPAASRDSRVLSILLILRSLSMSANSALHIVAENQQDQTATLAVAPKSNGYDPDFVNTQAIIARTLVMNLAYPEIQGAVSDLITNHARDSPNIMILEPDNLGILGQKANLGMIQVLLARKHNSRAVALGWFQGTKMVICPSFRKMVEFTEEYRIIIILRHPSSKSSSSVSERNSSVSFDASQYKPLTMDSRASEVGEAPDEKDLHTAL
jgi:hypothetical protein